MNVLNITIQIIVQQRPKDLEHIKTKIEITFKRLIFYITYNVSLSKITLQYAFSQTQHISQT